MFSGVSASRQRTKTHALAQAGSRVQDMDQAISQICNPTQERPPDARWIRSSVPKRIGTLPAVSRILQGSPLQFWNYFLALNNPQITGNYTYYNPHIYRPLCASSEPTPTGHEPHALKSGGCHDCQPLTLISVDYWALS